MANGIPKHAGQRLDYCKPESQNRTVMHRHIYIKSPADGLGLNTTVISVNDSPKGVLLFIHGLCGKTERMLPTMEHFSDKGYACVGFDMRGHGNSVRQEEDRGYTYKGGRNAMVMDIQGVIGWINSNFPRTPIFIIAHSMGSLAARAYLKGDDTHIKGLIICGSPSYNPMSPFAWFIMQVYNEASGGRTRPERLQKLVSDIYNKEFEDEGHQAWMCSDPEERKRFLEDPECNYTCTTDCMLTLLSLMKDTYSKKGWHMANPSLPILFISGEEDACMISMKDFHKSAGFLNKVGYTDVHSIIYTDMRHEVLHEIGKENVWNEIEKFISISGERQDG